MWKWITGRRERQASIKAAARALAHAHGEQARPVAVQFARLTRDGKQVEDGKDDQFWWRVALEIDTLQNRVRLDTATRYTDEP